MGTRGQVHITGTRDPTEDPRISDMWLYEHMDANYLPDTVKHALTRATRFDPEHLGRLIFCQMIMEKEPTPEGVKKYLEGELDFAIGSLRHGDIRWLIDVDTDAKWIHVVYCSMKTPNGKDYIMGSGDRVVWQGHFADFVSLPDQNGWDSEGLKK